MAKLIFDLSGNKGLAQKYYGDVDGSSNTHLQYQEEDSLADGIVNPLRRVGFLSASNTAYSELQSGLNIAAFVYDDTNDDIYAAEDGPHIYRLDTPTDVTYTTIVDLGTESISDMDLYEVNGVKALVYSYEYPGTEEKVIVGSSAPTKYDTWNPGKTGYGSVFFDNLIFAEGRFFGCDASYNYVYTSLTGYKDWERLYDFGKSVEMVKYLNNYLIIGGDNVASNFAYTNTLTTPTVVTDATSAQFQYFDGAYGAGLYVFAGDGPASTQILTWNGVTSFTLRTTNTEPLYGIVWSGTQFVTVGASGAVFTSPDGITWTSRTAAAANFWTSLAYGNGIYVATALSGTTRCMYSSDGITWTGVTTMDSLAIRGLTFADGYFIAVGQNGIYKSTNGATWTLLSSDIIGDSVSYGHGYFVTSTRENFGSAPDGSQLSRFFVSGTITNSTSGSNNRAAVGFYSLDRNSGLYSSDSPVVKTYPDTYEHQTISWNETATYTSEFQSLIHEIPIYELEDKKIEKIRLGLSSYLQENTSLKVSVYQGSSVSVWSLAYETTLNLTATDSPIYKEYIVDFGSQSSLTSANAFIIVTLNSLLGTTKNGFIRWASTEPGSSLLGNAWGYTGTEYRSIGGKSTNQTSFDVSIIKTDSSDWTNQYITNYSDIKWSGGANFIRKADNGFLYWFVDNNVHSIDGGETGGSQGILRKNLLKFPSYMKIVDAIDNRGRLFIGLQSAPSSTTLASESNILGVYVWDRLSSVTNFRDFIAIPGVKEIKAFFIDNLGGVNLICIANDKTVQIREYSGSEFRLVQTLGTTAYPASQRSISTINTMNYWLGLDGYIYIYGQVNRGGDKQLFKFAKLETAATATGAALTADNSASLNNLRIFASYKTASEEGLKIYKPYDSDANFTAGNDFYTSVKLVPSLSTIKYIRGIHIPDSVVSTGQNIAEVSCYINFNTTAAWTKTITQLDLNRGYWEKEYNKNNVNAIQFKVRWLGQTAAVGDYCPMLFEVNYIDESRKVDR